MPWPLREQRYLDYLAKFAETSEPDIPVRIAVFKALGKAGYAGLCRHLHEDECARRTDAEEQEAMWNYFADIAVKVDSDPQLADCLKVIETIFAYQMQYGAVVSPSMVLTASFFRRSERIHQMLKKLAGRDKASPEVRAVAIAALRPMRDEARLQQIKDILIDSLNEVSAKSIARECARRLAGSSPDLLLDINHPIVETELWTMSLRTGMLVFGDYIKDPSHGTASGGSEQLDRLLAQDDAQQLAQLKLSKVSEAGRVKRPSTAKHCRDAKGKSI